jgi:hypothetical protein
MVNKEGIDDKLQWAYDHRKEAEELGEKGRVKFTSYPFSWEFAAKEFDRIFKEVLGQNEPNNSVA